MCAWVMIMDIEISGKSNDMDINQQISHKAVIEIFDGCIASL